MPSTLARSFARARPALRSAAAEPTATASPATATMRIATRFFARRLIAIDSYLQNLTDRCPDDPHVEAETLPLHVLKVVPYPFLEVGLGGARAPDLPEPRDARAHGEPRLAPRRAVLVLLVRARARADDAHVPHEDVEELGDLVELEPSQDAPHAQHPRVVLDEELRAVRLVHRRQLRL